MKKPQLKDFTGNRQEKSRKYNLALKKWKKSQKDSSGKRTSYVDILGFKWKKEGDKYVQYRGDGSKTGKTRVYDINANKKQTGRGSRSDNTKKTSNNLKVKKTSTAKDRVGKVNLNSSEYKEAKKINERPVKYQTSNNNKKQNSSETETKEKSNIDFEKASKALNNTRKEVTMADFKSGDSDKKTEKTEKKKESRYIRNPKTGTLVSRKSIKGKQILKIQERRRKLNKKRFGK